MTKRQWIWLVIAILLFAGTGAVSVAVNTWSRETLAGTVTGETGLIPWMMAEEDVLSAGVMPEEPSVALVPVKGTIAEESLASAYSTVSEYDHEWILGYVDRLMEDENNAGILLFVDSGGGEMAASDELYLKLMEYKERTGRPVYAYFDGTACSGAYYVAMAADEIWANRNCICVNIGVYISTYNLSGLFERYGIEQVMIKSSENKGIGAVGEPWTKEQLAIYQSIVDLYYDQFLEVVADGRGMTKTQVRALDDGREMLASQAHKAGFVDGVCRTYDEFEAYVLEQLGVECVYEESMAADDPLSYLFDYVYGKAAALRTRSDGELLSDFVTSQDGITVMAYAG